MRRLVIVYRLFSHEASGSSQSSSTSTAAAASRAVFCHGSGREP